MGEPVSPLATPSATRGVLEAHGLATKKALGQNFLVNDAVVGKIIDLADVGPSDVVLEVGPGIGTLTIALLKHVARVVSVERDADLPAVLADTCAPWASRFALIEKDALGLAEDDVRAALAATDDAAGGSAPARSAAAGASGAAGTGGGFAAADGLAPGAAAAPSAAATPGAFAALPNKFVANLPYAVAATLVLDYFQRFSWLQSATVMVQKEVADRMAAHPGTKDYGAFTVKLALHARIVGRFAVGPQNFFPPPRVDSAVVRLNRAAPVYEDGRPVEPSVVRAAATMADAAFANRRKTLANSCKMYFASQGAAGAALAAALPELFEKAQVDPRLRGEALQVADFVRLGKALAELQRAN